MRACALVAAARRDTYVSANFVSMPSDASVRIEKSASVARPLADSVALVMIACPRRGRRGRGKEAQEEGDDGEGDECDIPLLDEPEHEAAKAHPEALHQHVGRPVERLVDLGHALRDARRELLGFRHVKPANVLAEGRRGSPPSSTSPSG